MLLAVCVALTLSASSSYADSHSSENAPIIAIFSLINDCDNGDAVVLFDSLITDRFNRVGFRTVPTDELRETLRKHRIRSAGEITSQEAAIIRNELNADFMLLGSCDIFIEDTVPEAGLSARLYDIVSGRIAWAESEAATGNDFAGLFGIGKISKMSKLADKLVEKLAKSAEKRILKNQGESQSESDKFALVTFDNLSENPHAGSIMTSILLSDMVDRGMTVEEPGNVDEAFRRMEKQPRGAVDLQAMQYLYDSLGVDFVITGTVDRFKAGRGEIAGSSPSIVLNGRIIDCQTGNIVGSYELDRSGSDSETLLGMGERHSLGRLAENMAHSLIDKLESHRKDWFAGAGNDNKREDK